MDQKIKTYWATGCEPFLSGWELRRLERAGDDKRVALGGAYLAGYLACALAQAAQVPTDSDAAMRAWTVSL